MNVTKKIGKIVSDYKNYALKRAQREQFGNPIFISGMQRSGTTWVANMLNVEGVRLYDQPFGKYSSILFSNEHFTEEEARRRIDYRFKRILKGKDYRHFNWSNPDHYKRQTSGKFSPVATFGLKRGRIIIKDPLAIENLSILSETRQIDFLILIRSPFGYVSSLKKLNWIPLQRLKKLLYNPKFKKFNFKENQYLRGKTLEDLGMVELSSLQYSMMKVLLEDFLTHTNSFVRVYEYEDLCTDPVGKFRGIFEEYSLTYNPKVLALHKALSENNTQKRDFEYNDYDKNMIHHFVKRNSKMYAEIWKDRLTLDEIRTIEAICDSFN